MPFSRVCVGLTIGISFLVSACGDDQSQTTAPTPDAAVPSLTYALRALDAAVAQTGVNVWMGSSTAELVQVRVVDQRSVPVAGVRVRFATRLSIHDAATRDSLAVVRTRDMATADVLSDMNGVATFRDVTFPSRDTVADAYTVVAELVDDRTEMVTSSLRIAAHAWRDVSRFGGDAPLVLHTTPIDLRELQAILPLGTFSGDDALPAADAMLVPRSALRPNVRAMATGIVTEIDRTNGAITMRVRDSIRIRISGVALRSALWVGAVVNEGDILGPVDPTLSGGVGAAVRVFDTAIQRQQWVRPERYGARRSASFFVKYLADSVRSNAYALVRRAAPDLAGTIDFDRAGRLIGSWFDPAASMGSLSASVNASTMAFLSTAQRAEEFDPSVALGAVALTFAYDAQKPGEVRVAVGRKVGGVIGMSGVRAVAWEDEDPAQVAVASGVVRYRLFDKDDASRVGSSAQSLLVQLIDDTHVKVELVSGSQNVRSFSQRAIVLTR